MLRLAMGTVEQVVERRRGVQILEVRMASTGQVESALSFAQEAYAKGDALLLNTTAVRLSLGTGGFHLVLGKADARQENDVVPGEWGHVMKMRYSPWQLAVDAVEEQDSPYHELFLQQDLSLEGTPVVIGELHSLLPVTAMALKECDPTTRVVYVMPDGASLPASFSSHVHHLKTKGMLDAVITTGHAWGGRSRGSHDPKRAARGASRGTSRCDRLHARSGSRGDRYSLRVFRDAARRSDPRRLRLRGHSFFHSAHQFCRPTAAALRRQSSYPDHFGTVCASPRCADRTAVVR